MVIAIIEKILKFQIQIWYKYYFDMRLFSTGKIDFLIFGFGIVLIIIYTLKIDLTWSVTWQIFFFFFINSLFGSIYSYTHRY